MYQLRIDGKVWRHHYKVRCFQCAEIRNQSVTTDFLDADESHEQTEQQLPDDLSPLTNSILCPPTKSTMVNFKPRWLSLAQDEYGASAVLIFVRSGEEQKRKCSTSTKI